MSASSLPILKIRTLYKDYDLPGGIVHALQLNYLDAVKGEAIAITGPSGSGKTTLLHLLAALSRPTGGSIEFDGQLITSFNSPSAAARWRAKHVGYVFQDANLLPDFSVLENLLIAAEISIVTEKLALERAHTFLECLKLKERQHHRPAKLSLGERQRAAVARALIHKPPIVLADEPTASLDAQNAEIVINLLLDLCRETILIVATHDEAVKKRFPRVVELRKLEEIQCA